MAANLGAIEAGKAFIKLSLNDEEVVKGFHKIGAVISGTAKSMKAISSGMAAVSAGLIAPFALGIRSMQTWGAQIFLVANRVDVAAGKIAALADLAEKVGTSYSALEIGLKTLGERKIQALAGSGETMAALQALGADREKFLSNSVEENLIYFADLISEVEDASLQSGYALRIFGEAGNQLLPLLRMGGDELRKIMESGRYNTSAIMESFEVSRDIKDLNQAFRGLTMTIASMVSPALRIFTRILALFLDRVNKGIQALGVLGPIIGIAALFFVGATIAISMTTAAMFALAGILAVIYSEVFTLNLLLTTTNILIATLTAGLSLLIATVAFVGFVFTAAAFAVGYFTSEGEDAFVKIADGFRMVVHFIVATIRQVIKFMGILGDVYQLFRILGEGLKLFGLSIKGPLDMILEQVDDLTEGLKGVKDGMAGLGGTGMSSMGIAGAYASGQTMGATSISTTNRLLETIAENTESTAQNTKDSGQTLTIN